MARGISQAGAGYSTPMTHHLGVAIVFFVVFFASLGVLLAGLYFLETTLDRPK